ncbi:hypothetical protein HV824_36200, partial [Myxococcus sp. AM009]
GNDTVEIYDDAPVQVTSLSDGVTAAAGGNYHMLVIRMDGTVWTWGRNSDGQLGDGTSLDALVPLRSQFY